MTIQQCRMCGNTGIIDVHGHLQCSKCGALVESCCEGSGDICPPDKDKEPHNAKE